jgi:environmental stress-induced protein Ves|tara:strand:- start:328 stop:894 length:567 start_codon:yes stop_codon:yes gene_type:complete
MNYKTIKASSFKSSLWSGGSTTELFIYPALSKYATRNFNFRLSTATVNVEESTFTSLPGTTRTLMVLDGEMTLAHKAQHTAKLCRFDSDNFNGDWETSSKGKCVDFNLMTVGDTEGTVEYLLVNKGKQILLSFSDNIQHLLIYVYSGQIKIEDATIETGDLAIFENPTKSIEIISVEKCDLIISKIFQ